MSIAAPLNSFVRRLARFAGKRLHMAVALAVLAACTDGVGLMLLMPLLALLGLGGDGISFGRDLLGRLPILDSLPAMLSLFVALIVARSVISKMRDDCLMRLRLEFADAIRLDLYRSIADARWSVVSGLHSSQLMHALNQQIPLVAQGTHFVLQLSVSLLLSAVYVVVAMYVSFWLTSLVLMLMLLLLVAMRRNLARAGERGRQMNSASAHLFTQGSDFTAGLKVAKSFGAERLHFDRYRESAARLREHQLEFIRERSNVRLLYETCGAAALATLVYAALVILAVPMVDVVVLIVVFSRMLPIGIRSFGDLGHVVNMLPAFSGVCELQARLDAAIEERREGDPFPFTLVDGLAVENVSFSYVGGSAVLRNLNLFIPARRTTAIIGPSGAGKSTLADLLIGLQAPTSGTVRIDKSALGTENVADWRRRVAYVPQDVFLFDGSIRENLRWFATDADDERLWSALDQAAAAGLVRGLPNGLDTVIGERGVRLSGGERQRLALARALLTRPLLLVLDEATSALDSDNERHIHQALQRLHGKLTIVLIAHRLTTVRSAHQIAVLEGGALAELGTWDQLIRAPHGYLGTTSERQHLSLDA